MRKLIEKLTEAIAPTKNKEWGFWGTINDRVKDQKLTKKAWDVVSAHLQKTYSNATPRKVAELLDSSIGRHFADSVITFLDDQFDWEKALGHVVKQSTWRKNLADELGGEVPKQASAAQIKIVRLGDYGEPVRFDWGVYEIGKGGERGLANRGQERSADAAYKAALAVCKDEFGW